MADDGTDSTLAGLLRGLAAAPAAELRPEHIARFRVTGTLGSGGMGVVYEGTDPTLGRRVAIKLLRAERSGSAADAAAARLLREAQALARLSHPNVVTIYEAGRDGERVYLAMELIVGATARAWCAAAPRSVAEIVAVYRQAASGLAAAHGAGMVHRDIKPENLLVGDDGRVRVTDFGLVAALELGPAPGHDPPAIDPMGLTMTRTGAVMGTPPYMPPEAHHGRSVDARGDQWSLAASIWEAIGGARPYAGATYPELVANICAGQRLEPPRPIPVPMRAALERALEVDPGARWPSVTALMAALEPARRGRGVFVVGGVALAGAAATGAWLLTTREPAAAAIVADAAAPAIAVIVAPPDAAPVPTGVKLRASSGAIELPCDGALCGDATLRADGGTLTVTVEAPPGLTLRLPGAEGGGGATLALALDPLVVRAELPANGGFAPLSVWAQVTVTPGAAGASHRVGLGIDRYVEARLGAARNGEVRWPGEVQPRFRRDVLVRMTGGMTGAVAYAGVLGPPGATLWEADLIAFEEAETRDTPCGQQTTLVIRVHDRRSGRFDTSQRFRAADAPCRADTVTTYDAAAADAWLRTLVEVRPDGVAEEPPPEVALGAAAAVVAARLDADALSQDAIDAVAKALHDEEPMWPGEAESRLAAKLRKLGVRDAHGLDLIGVLDEASGRHGDDYVDAIELTIPRSTDIDDVAGIVTPTWAALVIGHRTLVPDAGQALFDRVVAVAPDAGAMSAAAVALGWWEPEPVPTFGPGAVPSYKAVRLMLHGPAEAPIGASLVVVLDYADAVAGYDAAAVCDIASTRALCVRSDDRALARRLLDALR